eukprot:4738360-Heterocapsa_arctica.AAC.1
MLVDPGSHSLQRKAVRPPARPCRPGPTRVVLEVPRPPPKEDDDSTSGTPSTMGTSSNTGKSKARIPV